MLSSSYQLGTGDGKLSQFECELFLNGGGSTGTTTGAAMRTEALLIVDAM